MYAKLFFVAVVSLCFLGLACANVLELHKDNFHQHVDGSSNVLVEFYAPWCGHCKNLAPEYKLAAEAFQPGDDVKLVAVDATESGELADKYGVKGYPTLKFFPKGSTEPVEYEGGRTADTIVSWLNSKAGTSRRVKLPPTHVATLTTDSFDSIVAGGKSVLVEFYAPWCGHCKSLAPKYEQLAKAFAGEEDVVVAKVDATEEEDLAARFEISGYPTLKFFPAGSSEPESYDGQREVEAMVDFINSRAGTHRLSDGTLKAQAGRVAALDKLLQEFDHAITSDVVQAIKSKVAELDSSLQTYGKLYVGIAEKILAKGADYVQTEAQRLTKLAAGANVQPKTKTSFFLRKNILAAFVPGSDSEEL